MKYTVEIPNLSDITLEQYQKYLMLDKKQDEIFYMQKIIEIFCNVDNKTALNTKYHSLSEATSYIMGLFEKKPPHQLQFKMNGVEYGFVHLDDITFGEFVDLDTYIAEPENLHKAFAVLYRPIKHKYKDYYNISDYNPAASYIMKKTPLNIVLGAIGFFLSLSQDLHSNLTIYLANQMKNLTPQQAELSKIDGDGMHQYISYLVKAYSNLTKWRRSDYINV